MLTRRSSCLALVALGAAAVVGCDDKAKPGPQPAGADKPVVAVSIFPVYDLVRQVAGDAARVELMLPPGKSAHSYQPSVKDVRKIASAKLALLVGLHLDDWAAKVVQASAPKAKLVRLGTHVKAQEFNQLIVGSHDEHEKDHDEHDEHEKGHDKHEKEEGHDEHDEHDEHEKGHDKHEKEKGHDEDGSEAPLAHHHPKGPDPHVWLNVEHAITLVKHVVEELSGIAPASAAAFEANGEKVQRDLKKLHAEIKARLGKLPRKNIVTFHGSFGYFAQAYGLRIVAVVEPYPGKEPSAAYIKELLAAVKGKQVGALYTEPQLGKRPAEVVAKEAELSVRELDPIGGQPDRDSYMKLMMFNVAAFEATLK